MEISDPKRPWTLRILPDRLRFDPPEGAPALEVPRPELHDRVVVMDGLFLRRFLSVQGEGKKRKGFRLDRAAFHAYLAWAGAPTRRELKTLLKRRLRWTLTLGLLSIVSSLPIAGDPERGVPSHPFDPSSLALGVSLILVGIVSRLAPSPVFFLIDSLWFLVMAVNTARSALEGLTAPWLAALFVFFDLCLIISGVKEYLRLWRAGPPRDDPREERQVP